MATNPTIACPSCGRQLALPEQNWRALAQCPACSAIFTPGQDTSFRPGALGAPSKANDELQTAIQPHRPRTGRRRRRRGRGAGKAAPLVSRGARIAFFVGMGLYVLTRVLMPPMSPSPGQPGLATELLLAPIIGMCVAVAFVALQTWFGAGEGSPGARFLKVAAGVGFIVSTPLVALAMLTATPSEFGAPRISVPEVLLTALLLGLLIGFFFAAIAFFFLGLGEVPTLLALAAQNEDDLDARHRVFRAASPATGSEHVVDKSQAAVKSVENPPPA